MADPDFIPQPDNCLVGLDLVGEFTASEDGSRWLVRSFSPTNRQGKKRGSYDVVFCKKTGCPSKK